MCQMGGSEGGIFYVLCIRVIPASRFSCARLPIASEYIFLGVALCDCAGEVDAEGLCVLCYCALRLNEVTSVRACVYVSISEQKDCEAD